MNPSQAQLDSLVTYFKRSEAEQALREAIDSSFIVARGDIDTWDEFDEFDEEGVRKSEESIIKQLREQAWKNFTWFRHHYRLVRNAVRANPGPPVITEADLRSLIETALVIHPDDYDVDAVYGKILDSLTRAAAKFERGAHTFLVSTGIPRGFSHQSPFCWSSKTGYQLRIPIQKEPDAVPSPHPWGNPEGLETFGSIEGLATEEAFRIGSRQCATVACALVQMMRLAGCWEERPRGGIFRNIGPMESDESEILRSALDTYFAPPNGKGSTETERRLANGLHLWCLAEQQTRPGLRISLAVASLEAMLGEKSEGGLARVLGERVAVLLYRDSSSRNGMARFVRKTLYACRSNVLHGNSLEESVDDRLVEQALRLAALVFRAYWEDHNYGKPIPESEGRSEFLGQLEDQMWGEKADFILPESLAKAAMALWAEIRTSTTGIE